MREITRGYEGRADDRIALVTRGSRAIGPVTGKAFWTGALFIVG
jgi:hypothetical protein